MFFRARHLTQLLLIAMPCLTEAQTAAQRALDREPEVRQISALEQHLRTGAVRSSRALSDAQAERQARGERPSVGAGVSDAVTGAYGSAMDTFSTIREITGLWNLLDNRFRDQLIECQGK